ncbi:thiol:disulfide interchange protein DsbG [Streptosporangium jomthongense]|uniref:Thiol:disulfide interchange protein n=1 Tax=Marinobacter aromaticivorans TaxID=1494078 RepID=A0ABW2IWA3_9GAMM|nr:thiol:disulfide interchange protein DsbG [Marinobacter aromaticivorans]GGE71469.1 thiol:disulfide interchange protein DsbG [Streptosporangium jomthongense]
MQQLLKTLTKPSMLAAAMAATSFSLPTLAQSQDSYPKAVQQLVDRGVTIAESFEAPGGMTGYAGSMQGRPIALYLTADKEQVIVGTMLSANGDNLTAPKLQELVVGPQNEKAWAQLEQADWVRDGDASAPVIVYTFTDPNCPFCHRFRQAAAPWIDAGEVQLRHIMVGILKQDSLPKAATILGSENPREALKENQQNHSAGGIEVDRQIVSDNAKRVQKNNQLMSSLGLSATPSTYYKDAQGTIQMKQGAPRPGEMEAIMGGPKP